MGKNATQPGKISDKPFPETTSIDVGVKEIKNFKLGQKVMITIKGEITELRTPARKEDEWDKPCIRVKVLSKDVEDVGEYDKLDKDDMDED